MEKVCIKFIQIESLNISYFQLKNSNIRKIEDNTINQIYQIIHLTWIYIEPIYAAENNIKLIIEYTIGRGNIGTWKGIGVNGWVYEISIPNRVSLQNTCHHNKAQIKPINKTNRKEIVNQSI